MTALVAQGKKERGNMEPVRGNRPRLLIHLASTEAAGSSSSVHLASTDVAGSSLSVHLASTDVAGSFFPFAWHQPRQEPSVCAFIGRHRSPAAVRASCAKSSKASCVNG